LETARRAWWSANWERRAVPRRSCSRLWRKMQNQHDKVLGVIPARWASTRLPGKSLVPLCGKPLILWVLERARQAERLDEVVVATDDDRIRSVVERAGGTAVMTRSDHPSGTDRVAEAASGRGAAVIINVQGDEPLIDPQLINRLADAMVKDQRWDMATAATPVRDAEELNKPSVVKVVWDHEGRALYFSRSVIPFIRDRMPAGLRHWRHLGIYAYRKEFLATMVAASPCELERAEQLEQLRALYLGARIRVVEAQDVGVGVDMPEDVTRAEAAIRRAGLAG
jgi:3-deoxy-manno-octulosonate cytidylyltransferase (CMP-KDO synthetase)